jgi:hypothetical protein
VHLAHAADTFGMRAARSIAEPCRPPVRASDAERDQAISALRERYAEGRLTKDTFVRRVDAALRARERSELAQLFADLPSARPLAAAVASWLARTGHAARSRVSAVLAAPPPPALVFPRGTASMFTIGRAQNCDLVLAEDSVSRYHARLDRHRDGWLLGDLGSTNGTMLNGWRVTAPVAVRAGDWVSFGRATFQVRDDR